MASRTRPLSAKIFAGLLLVAALGTAYVGTMAAGFLVPAASLMLAAALIWLGRGYRVLAVLLALNIASEVLLDVVTSYGHGLGVHRLDVAGAALLANLATGGPVMLAIAVALLVTRHFNPALRTWLTARAPAQT